MSKNRVIEEAVLAGRSFSNELQAVFQQAPRNKEQLLLRAFSVSVNLNFSGAGRRPPTMVSART
jgi:hypothetical protein